MKPPGRPPPPPPPIMWPPGPGLPICPPPGPCLPCGPGPPLLIGPLSPTPAGWRATAAPVAAAAAAPPPPDPACAACACACAAAFAFAFCTDAEGLAKHVVKVSGPCSAPSAFTSSVSNALCAAYATAGSAKSTSAITGLSPGLPLPLPGSRRAISTTPNSSHFFFKKAMSLYLDGSP